MSLACSVVIPTYNAAETLGEQLAALAAQDGDIAFEVIVSDNGSTDDSESIAMQWSSTLDVRVVDASARRGPSAARNIGAEYASAPLLLFCDADDVVGESWVNSLVTGLDGSAFVGGPCLPFADRSDIWLPDYATDRLPLAWDSWPYAFAGNLGITAAAFRVVGGFDESLTGAEEIEFALRARTAGFEPTFVPDACIAYRARTTIRGRLWHEYNSGRGTTMLGQRIRPESFRVRSWKSQLRHDAMLLSRFPRSMRGNQWAGWAATLAFEAGSRTAKRLQR